MAGDDTQMLTTWLEAKFERMVVDEPRLARESEPTAAAGQLCITILDRSPRRRSVTDGKEDPNLEAYLSKTWSCELNKFHRNERQSGCPKKRVSLDAADNDESRLKSTSDQSVKEAQANELQSKLQDALERLDTKEQWIITACAGYYQPKISLKEIAKALKITPPTARKRREAAKEHLCRELAIQGVTREDYINDDR
jgi:RNA polymerase sigma factor (sigma-70 family)